MKSWSYQTNFFIRFKYVRQLTAKNTLLEIPKYIIDHSNLHLYLDIGDLSDWWITHLDINISDIRLVIPSAQGMEYLISLFDEYQISGLNVDIFQVILRPCEPFEPS